MSQESCVSRGAVFRKRGASVTSRAVTPSWIGQRGPGGHRCSGKSMTLVFLLNQTVALCSYCADNVQTACVCVCVCVCECEIRLISVIDEGADVVRPPRSLCYAGRIKRRSLSIRCCLKYGRYHENIGGRCIYESMSADEFSSLDCVWQIGAIPDCGSCTWGFSTSSSVC